MAEPSDNTDAVSGRKIAIDERRPEMDKEMPKAGHFILREDGRKSPQKRIHKLADQLESTDIDVFSLSNAEIKTLLEYMYTDLGIFDDLQMHISTLREFFNEIEKCYRNENYFHNFRHCFCVTQMMYMVLRKTKLATKFTPQEKAALITSCVCHDLDHPGMSNNYQREAKTELYTTYNNDPTEKHSPTLEKHHLAVTKRILKRRARTPPIKEIPGENDAVKRSDSDQSFGSLGSMSYKHGGVDVEQVLQYYQDKENPEASSKVYNEGETEEERMARDQERLDTEGGKARPSALQGTVWDMNIFNNIAEEDQERLMEVIAGLIMCTDMTGHKEFVDKFRSISEPEIFDFSDPEHKKLLMKILVKACDISNEARSTEVSEKWCVLLLKEYFAQSDYEKSKGLKHGPWMDRETQTKSSSQIFFMTDVLIPIFQLLHTVYPELKELTDNLAKNLKFYQDLRNDPVRDSKDVRKEPLPPKKEK